MRKYGLLGCFAVLLMIPSTSQAQVAFGPQVSWATEIEEIAVGARIQAGMPSLLAGLQLIGSADYYFMDCNEGAEELDIDCSLLDFNANAAYSIMPLSRLDLYIGGGLNIMRMSVEDFSDTDTGINILAGVKFPGTTIRPFAEGRYTIGGDAENRFTITGGLLFGPR